MPFLSRQVSPEAALKQRTISLSRYCSEPSEPVALSKITINCLEEGQSFILEADFDLIEHIFRGLEDLLWKSPMRLSSCTVVGQLLTNGSDLHHYCGHVLSPRALEEAVAEALTASTIGLFASLCCFVIPSLRCYRSDVRGHRVPVTVGPDIPAARTVHQDSLSAERLSIVDDFTRDLQKLWAVFEATPTSAKSNAFSSIVKQWMLMKQKFNIQSENNQLARDIDAALLEAYEALHRNGAFEAPFGATLIPMVRDCLAGQLHEVPCTRDRPVLTSMPARLRQLILSDLWPLLVLSEAFGVQRLFSALSYVMLQQLRQSATVEMEKNKSACSDLSAGELQLLSSLATHEGDLDTSLSADSEEAAENGAKDSAQDISIEHSRRSAPPVPISHPAVLLRESVSMFDDDEDGNKSLLCESLSVIAVPSRSILSDWSLCRHKSEIHQSSETDILQQAVKSVYLCTEKSNFTRHSIALVTPTKGQVETPTSANKADRCTPEIEAQRRALSRLREHRRGASRSPRPVRPSVQDRLAAVRCEAAIARTRSSSPAAHKRRPASPAPGVSKVLFSPQPNASSRQNKDGFLKGTPTIVSALSSVKLWGSPDAATDGDSHPHTPTTVVDIDETISRATLKAKERIQAHRRELEEKLRREQMEAQDVEEEKWRDRDRRLALFMNRQSNGPPASQLDRDRRGHQINETTQYIPSTQKKQEVRFAEDSIVAQHVIYRGFDPDRASQLVLQDDAHSYNKYQKVKKYRRFTKLLYGNTEEASPHSTSHNSEFSKKDPSLHIPQTSKDVVEEAEEVHNLIVDALSPTSRRNVSAASHESGKDITGYIKDGRRIMPVINKKDENMSSQSRSSVFSPDKTYRHLPDQQYSGSPESDMNVKPVREVNDESPHTSDHPVVEVYRASKLPEMLSGCNPYFIFDWGEWGKAVTSSKFNVANPVYKESLLFDGDHDMYSAPSIDVYAFHKNVSISDEFIGKGHISEVNISNGVHIVHLFDAEGDQAGEVVVELVIPTIC